MGVTHREIMTGQPLWASSTPPLIQQHIVAIKLITQREQMREMGVSDALRYTCIKIQAI